MSKTRKTIDASVSKGVLDVDAVADAARRQMSDLDNPGFCIKCGAERDGCEPDAEGYECYECGAMAVYGASELLMYIA